MEDTSEKIEKMATAKPTREHCFPTQTKGDDQLEMEMDWYGNYPLHHACGRTPNTNRFDISYNIYKLSCLYMPHSLRVLSILRAFPTAASSPNQFGRLPLHYALDRCKANVEVVKMLIEEYPQVYIYLIHRHYSL